MPLHARILGMFDQLEEEYHNCWFDNLYLSAKFAKALFTHDKKIQISGPTRKSGRWLPKCVIQEGKKNPSEISAVCGTVKATVLDGDTEVPNLVAVSYYESISSPPFMNQSNGLSVQKRFIVLSQSKWRYSSSYNST